MTADTTRPSSGRLPTGWEPDVPLDDTELRRFVHAYAEALAEPVTACGGRLVAGDGFLAADAGRPAGFFNGAMLLHPPDFERWPQMLACVEAALLGEGAGDVYLWSAWPTPDLRARGWKLKGFPPYLLRLPGGPLPPDAPDLSVRPVTDAVALADWERVVVEGYPFGATLPWRPGVLVDKRVLGSRYRMWVGYAEGRPVGAAASYLGHGLHVLGIGVVLPGHRRRGYWEALLRTRLAWAGDRPSASLFSDMSRPGAQRHGYVPISRFILWRRPRGT